jgi:hypothetical protein
MAQTQVECTEMINNDIAVQVLDALMENIAHAQTQVKELIEKFYILT